MAKATTTVHGVPEMVHTGRAQRWAATHMRRRGVPTGAEAAHAAAVEQVTPDVPDGAAAAEQAEALERAGDEAAATRPPGGIVRIVVAWAQDAMGAEALVIVLFWCELPFGARKTQWRGNRFEIAKEAGEARCGRPQAEIAGGGPDP